MLPEKGVGHGRHEKRERERETSVVLEWEATGATKTESVKRKISFYSIIQATITDYQLDTTFCCSLNRWPVISGGNLTVILYLLKQGLSDKSDHIQQILTAKDLYPNFLSWHSEHFHLFSYSSFTLSSVQTQLLWVWIWWQKWKSKEAPLITELNGHIH